MRFNEKNGESYNGKIVYTGIKDSSPIFEVSCIVLGELSSDVIKANYNLIVNGDLEASSLTVMGNFICLGSCRVEKLYVQGDAQVYGDLEITEEGLVSGNLHSKDISLNSLEVRGNIFCDSINFDDVLVCGGKCIISEGIMGAGIVQCQLVLCGEYASNEDERHVVIASEIEALLESKEEETQSNVENMLDLIKEKAVECDWDEFHSYLNDVCTNHPEYNSSLALYEKLLTYAEFSKFSNLKEYIELVDIVYGNDPIISGSDLNNMLKTHLLKKASTYIENLAFPAISKSEFATLLFQTVKNEFNMDSSIYRHLLEQLYGKIGLKYNTVCMILGDD